MPPLHSRPQSPQPLTQSILLNLCRTTLNRRRTNRLRTLHLLMQFDACLIRNLVHKPIDILLRRANCGRGRSRVFIVSGRDIEIFELGLEAIHYRRYLSIILISTLDIDELGVGKSGTNLLQIHSLHSLIHPFDYIHHAARHLAHRDRCLYSARHRIDPASQSQQIQSFILLADGVLGVDLCDVVVSLLDSLISSSAARSWCVRGMEGKVYLLELVLLGLLVLAGFCCLAVELLRCELFSC